MDVHVCEELNIDSKNKLMESYVVKKWAARMSDNCQKTDNFGKKLEYEIAKLKVMYPFLDKSQIRGKVLKNFNMPSVMGQIPKAMALCNHASNVNKGNTLQKVTPIKHGMSQQKVKNKNEMNPQKKDSIDTNRQPKHTRSALKDIKNIPSKLKMTPYTQNSRTAILQVNSYNRKDDINMNKTRKRIPQIYDDLEDDSKSDQENTRKRILQIYDDLKDDNKSDHSQNIVTPNTCDDILANGNMLKKRDNLHRTETSLFKVQKKKSKKVQVHEDEKNKENEARVQLANENSYQLQIRKNRKELHDAINPNTRNTIISSQRETNKNDMKNQKQHHLTPVKNLKIINKLHESLKFQYSEQIQSKNQFKNNIAESKASRTEVPVSEMKSTKNYNIKKLLPNKNIEHVKNKPCRDTKDNNVQSFRKKLLCTNYVDSIPDKCNLNIKGQKIKISDNSPYKIDNKESLSVAPKEDENTMSNMIKSRRNIEDSSAPFPNFNNSEKSGSRKISRPIHISESQRKKKTQKRKLFCTSICKKGRECEDITSSSDSAESDFDEDDCLSENESNISEEAEVKEKLLTKKINISEMRKKWNQYNIVSMGSKPFETDTHSNKIKNSSFTQIRNVSENDKDENIDCRSMHLETQDETESESNQLPSHSPIQYLHTDSFSSSEDDNTGIEDALEAIDKDILSSEIELHKSCSSTTNRLAPMMLKSPRPPEDFPCYVDKNSELTSDTNFSGGGIASADGDLLADAFDPIPEDDYYCTRPMYSEETDEDNCSTLMDSI
ncbi:hypothetical protein C0J52_01827 [Blattella germanica]|nr:hypothetical protein C0J52_01827 [Blattella germanica]